MWRPTVPLLVSLDRHTARAPDGCEGRKAMADTKPPNLWKSLFSWALPDSTPSSRELKYYNKLTSKYGLVSGACQR